MTHLSEALDAFQLQRCEDDALDPERFDFLSEDCDDPTPEEVEAMEWVQKHARRSQR